MRVLRTPEFEFRTKSTFLSILLFSFVITGVISVHLKFVHLSSRNMKLINLKLY